MTAAVVIEMLTNLVKIGASPGGLAVLSNMFTDHGLTPEKVAAAAKQMPDAPAPRKD